MTNINKNNYEIYFLDYLEGRLDAAQTAALMIFIDANPDLKEELEGLENLQLLPDSNIRFEGKRALKKETIIPAGNVNEDNYEEFMVAFAENDLDARLLADYHEFLTKNPSLKKEAVLFSNTRLKADRSVIYPDKESLKKTVVLPLFSKKLYYRISLAASVALLIGLFFLINPYKTGIDEPALAEQIVPEPVNPAPSDAKNTDEHSLGASAEAIEDVKESKPEVVRPYRQSEQKDFVSRDHIIMNTLASLPAPDWIDYSAQTTIRSELRTYFTNYYADLAMAQNMRHIEMLEDEPSPEKLFAQGSAVVREIFQPSGELQSALPDQIDLWKVADLSINGFARITGADIGFQKSTDNQGRVTSVAFQSQALNFSRDLSRPRK
jgi:hypothetical protein